MPNPLKHCARFFRVRTDEGARQSRIKLAQSPTAAPEIAEVPPFSAETLAEIDKVIENFSLEDAVAVKAIEATTNHDVKAIEYWLKNVLPKCRKSPP